MQGCGLMNYLYMWMEIVYLGCNLKGGIDKMSPLQCHSCAPHAHQNKPVQARHQRRLGVADAVFTAVEDLRF